MAQFRACNGVIKIDTVPPSGQQTVGELRSWSRNEEADEIDVSSMGSCTKASQAGAVKTSVECAAWWDPSDLGQVMFVTGNEVALEIFPDGEGSGKTAYTGTIRVLTNNISGDVDGVVESEFSGTANGDFPASIPVP